MKWIFWGALAPLQGDAMQPHQPLAVRGEDGHGAVAMACATCHGASNYVASANVTVPGSPDWHLARSGDRR